MTVAIEPASAIARQGAGNPVHLRLATWNLNHWRQPLLPSDTRRAAWDHLSTAIGAQVALVQEAVPPIELGRDRAVYGEIGAPELGLGGRRARSGGHD